MITGRADIREAYRNETTARDYVQERFITPLGAMLHDRQVRAVRRIIRRERCRRILEIAPGPARLSVEVSRVAPSLVLVDTSAEMLDAARHRLHAADGISNARLIQADAFELPFRCEFDLVYTFRLIRHFDQQDRLSLFGAVRSVLRRGGVLLFDAVNERVSAPFRAGAASKTYTHFDALLDPPRIATELSDAGFELEALLGVQRRYHLLRILQIYVAPRAAWFSRLAMEAADRLGGEPLEWIVVCRRT